MRCSQIQVMRKQQSTKLKTNRQYLSRLFSVLTFLNLIVRVQSMLFSPEIYARIWDSRAWSQLDTMMQIVPVLVEIAQVDIWNLPLWSQLSHLTYKNQIHKRGN